MERQTVIRAAAIVAGLLAVALVVFAVAGGPHTLHLWHRHPASTSSGINLGTC